MYLVTGYWRGALNISGMRLVTTPKALKREVDVWYKESYYHMRNYPNAYEVFLAKGNYRVYKMTPDVDEEPKLLRGNELKELLDNA